MLERDAIALPEINAIVMRAGHDAHSFGLCVESRMFEKSSEEMRSVVGPHIQPHETISWVTQRSFEEIPVQSEERHAPMPVQQWHYVGILHAEPREILPNAPEWNVPFLQ